MKQNFKILLHGIQSEISNKIEPTWLVWRTSMSPQTLLRFSTSLSHIFNHILYCILVFVSRIKRAYMRFYFREIFLYVTYKCNSMLQLRLHFKLWYCGEKCGRCGHNCACNVAYTSKILFCSRNGDCIMQLRTMPIGGGGVMIFNIVENCGNIGSLNPQSPFAAQIAIADFFKTLK